MPETDLIPAELAAQFVELWQAIDKHLDTLRPGRLTDDPYTTGMLKARLESTRHDLFETMNVAHSHGGSVSAGGAITAMLGA